MAFKAEAVFKGLRGALSEAVCEQVGVVFQFDVTNAEGSTRTWVVDAKNGPGAVTEGGSNAATCTIAIGDDDLEKLVSGKLSGMAAFTSGKMKIKGNVMQSQKLQKLLQSQKAPASKL
eukprot:RCo022160